MKKGLMLFGLFISLVVPAALAAPHAASLNVAVIPSYSGAGSAGTLVPADFPGYNFTQVGYAAVTSKDALANYDTVILYQACAVQSYPTLCSALIGWLQTYGGKLIIWDSDSCMSGNYAYTFLNPVGAYFERYSPGQTGNSGGTLTITENNYFNSSDPASAYYINTGAMTSDTDAVGDLNVVNENTVSTVWCALMRGVNTYNRSGYAHMYTKPGGLTGAPEAMVIYCGLDTDYWRYGYNGSLAMLKLMRQELQHGWGPAGSAEVADLTCQAPIGNLVLTPATAVNPVGQAHTVTATVSIYNFGTGQTVPVPNTAVNFVIISGPNAGLSGTATSDANGQVTLTYTGAGGEGTDVIQAQATVNGVLKTATAQKTWCNPPVVTRTLAGNRGYYTLTATSDCYAAPNLPLFVKDSLSAFVAGPFQSGTTVRIVRGTPGTGPGTGTASVTVRVVGIGLAYAVDPLGTSSALVTCPP